MKTPPPWEANSIGAEEDFDYYEGEYPDDWDESDEYLD
jgi:hypothetical protein